MVVGLVLIFHSLSTITFIYNINAIKLCNMLLLVKLAQKLVFNFFQVLKNSFIFQELYTRKVIFEMNKLLDFLRALATSKSHILHTSLVCKG